MKYPAGVGKESLPCLPFKRIGKRILHPKIVLCLLAGEVLDLGGARRDCDAERAMEARNCDKGV